MLSSHQLTAIYCIVDDLLKASSHKQDARAKLSDSEIILIGIVAALDFGGVWLYALQYLKQTGCLTQAIHKSRLSHRLKSLEPLAEEIFQALGQLFCDQTAEKEFILDSTSLEVCDNIRIRRCRMVQGEDFRGYKASFRRYFYGLRLQLLTTSEGLPVAYCITEASLHDARAMKLMNWEMAPESRVYADAAYNDYVFEDEMISEKLVRWLPQRRQDSRRQRPKAEERQITRCRKRIETVFSQIKSLFRRTLKASDIEGFMRKIKFFIYAFQLKSLLK